VAPYLALVLVVTGIVVFALRAEGYQTHRAELNDGGVWVTNSALGYYGRVNKPIGQLDGALFARSDATLDIVQDGAAVVGVDVAGGTASTIDPSSVAVPNGSTAQIPVGAQVMMHGGTLAALDPATGKVWAIPVDTTTGDPVVGGIDASSKPLETAGAGATMTVTASGRVVLATAGSRRLTTLTPHGNSYARSTTTLAHAPGKGATLTAVGDRVVLLDPASSTLTVVGGGHAAVDSGSVLQQPGPDADSVLVADGSRLISVRLDNGSISVISHDLTGSPAAPVRLGSCEYGAWGGAGLVVTRCGDATAQVGQLGAGTTSNLVFRVNRGQIVLNDTSNGAVWSVDNDQPTRLDDWQSFQKKVVRTKKNDQQQSKSSGDRTPPKAQPDQFGARPGRTTVLHPLDNDAAPAGRLLAISAVQDVRPAGAHVAISPDGQTVEITLSTRPAATTTFEYFINDGRQSGGTAHANVTVTARGPNMNQPPALRKGYEDKQWHVPATGVLTMPVLADWRDNADGDPLSLANARVVSGPQGTAARVTSSGQVRFTAADKGGDATVEYGVSDGIADPVEHRVQVHVQAPVDHQAYPATAEPDVVVGQAGKPITIHPLDNDLPGSDPINPDADLKLAGKVTSASGGQVQTDVSNGTVTFRSDQPKTYFLDYDAAFGNAGFSRGRIRVDVRAADHPPKPPVAMPDSLTIYGQSAGMVDVLANDVDPAGQVLVVQGVQTTTAGQLDASVVDGRWVRIAATRPAIGPNPQVVHYTISDGDRSGIQGDIVVSQKPAPTDDTPVTQGDQVTVRAGNGTQVSVLDNDFSPDGEQLHLVTDPGTSGVGAGQLAVTDPTHTAGATGQAYVSGKTVRFNAPAKVTDPVTETVSYIAANERGVTAPGTLRVTILPAKSPNQPPEPTVLEGRVVAGDQVRITLPTSGIDPDGDPVSITGISSAPTLGRVLRAGADSLVYQAFPNSAGTDDFTYTVADTRGATATGTVRVGVVPPAMPAAPVAVDDTATVAPGRTMTVDVLANDQVAPTDKVTVSLVRPAPDGVTIDADTGAMRIKAPAHADGREIQVNYNISDGLQSSQATVTLRTQTGYDNPPVINDAYGTDVAGGASAARVSVDVLKGAYDPDGPISALKVAQLETPPGISAQVHGGTVTIDRATTTMVVPFVVTDADGGAATARLYVPPRGDATPYVKSDAMITVQPGQDLQAQLKDYVVNPSRGQVRFTLRNQIWAAPAADVSASITGNGTFTVHAAKDYQGPGAVSFEVTTGKATAILTVPVQVGQTKPVLRCPSDPIPVAQGQKINIDVGAVCHVWTADQTGALTYSADWKTSAPGLSIIQAQGSQISVQAAGGTRADTTATLQLRAGDSDPAYLPITVVAVPPPTLAPITIADLKAGQSRTVDLAPYLHAGVPMPQPQVLSATQTSALDVHASAHGSSVTLSSGAKAHGTATFRVVMSDVAGDAPPANRTVEGRLTVSLQAAPDAPAAPHPGQVDSGQVMLSWNAPQANGSPITSYQVRADHGGPMTSCPTTACTVTGLRNGTDYTFQVRAVNAVGPSDWSPSSTVANPDAKPLPVTGVTETAVGDGSVTLRWNRPANAKETSALTYLISYGGGKATRTSKTTQTVSGLSNDNTYVFYITAINAKGWSSEPTASGTYQSVGAPGTPGAPTVTTTPSADDSAVVKLSWDPVDSNGPGPVRYSVISVPYADGGTCNQDTNGITGTSCTFTGIQYDGTQYQFKVEAIAPGTGTGVPGGQSRRSQGPAASWKAIGLPGKWGSWSVAPTGTQDQVKISGFTVPPSHGAVSTLKVYRGGSVVDTINGTPPRSLTESTPDDHQSYDFHLEVCNENACSPSSTQSVQSYGPLGQGEKPTIKLTKSGDTVSGAWTADGNGKGATVTVTGQGYSHSWSIDGGDNNGASFGPVTVGYDTQVTYKVVVTDPSRGSGDASAQDTITTDPAPPPSVSVSRGDLCTKTACTPASACTDATCGHIDVTLGNLTGTASCTVSTNPSNGGFSTQHLGAGTTQTSWFYGYGGGTVTVSCTSPDGKTGTGTMTWPTTG